MGFPLPMVAQVYRMVEIATAQGRAPSGCI